jgi:hypothetical protein
MTMVLCWLIAARYGVLGSLALPAIRLLAIGTLVASFLLHAWHSASPHVPGAKNTPAAARQNVALRGIVI